VSGERANRAGAASPRVRWLRAVSWTGVVPVLAVLALAATWGT
jgi:hypothetical protein